MPINLTFLQQVFPERVLWAENCGSCYLRTENGSSCLKGTELHSGLMKRLWRWVVVTVPQPGQST